jgi:alanine racemase
MAVVKANGYGHGAEAVARTALQNGADMLAVAILDEALALWKAGIESPVLILGYTPLTDMETVIDHGFIQTVYRTEQGAALSESAARLGKKARVHIKIDTGMGRIGFLPDKSARREILDIASLPGLEIEGIFTHFATADALDKRYQHWQLERFLTFVYDLKKEGLEIELSHAANSAAIMDCPEAHLDLVRAGILIYGVYPSREVNRACIDIRPVMTWKAQVAQVKRVGSGVSISYGCRFTTGKPTEIVTLPLGYADGYSRLLSNRSEVLINGHRLPVVGLVCMDQLMVDAAQCPDVEVGNEAVLVGSQGENTISADDLADWMETNAYEILCGVSARVPRILTHNSNGKITERRTESDE